MSSLTRGREQACLHADETPVDTLDPGSGKPRQSYLFAYRSTAGPPIIVFDYASSRSGKHVREFLGDWRPKFDSSSRFSRIGQRSHAG